MNCSRLDTVIRLRLIICGDRPGRARPRIPCKVYTRNQKLSWYTTSSNGFLDVGLVFDFVCPIGIIATGLMPLGIFNICLMISSSIKPTQQAPRF